MTNIPQIAALQISLPLNLSENVIGNGHMWSGRKGTVLTKRTALTKRNKL